MTCPGCGHENPPGSAFCNACGARQSPTSTLSDVAQKMLVARAALVGERKQVTVLFADMKASMELLAERDPEEARALLDAILERMMEAVHRYEGTVNQVMGDGIMALFGAPLAHEDHAVRACYAALRMQAAVTSYAREIDDGGGRAIQIRVGVNSGEVVVRSIGNDLHMDYTAVGLTTHLAARMEQLAAPGSILITHGTLKLADDAIAVRALGTRTVKGLDGALDVYELVGALPASSSVTSAVARPKSRFVGREAELARLRTMAAEAREGRGHVVALCAEPGLGKSRLIYELLQSSECRDWRVLEARSLSYETSAAWVAAVQWLRRYFGLQGCETIEDIAATVSRTLLELDAGLLDIVPAVQSVLGAVSDDDAWQALEAAEHRRRVLDSIARLVLAESERQPVMLVLENLQWVDPESRSLVDELLRRLPSAARAMVVVDYRPEFVHDWTGRAGFMEIVLKPLSREAADELVDTLLLGDRRLADLKRLIVERGQGNPFFMEEILRSLLETKGLVHEPGEYRLTADLRELQVPVTVQAIIAARIDRLRFDDKRLLQSAAVLGLEVSVPLLQMIIDAADDSVQAALARLVAAGFLEPAALGGGPAYRFRNSLTRDVAAASLLKEQRRRLHARIVETIERLYPDALATWIDQLAEHAFQGELWAKAADYSRLAGARAAAHAANARAIHAYEAALQALARVPRSRAMLEAAIDVRLELCAPLLQRGRLDALLAVAREAEAGARELDDAARLARVYTALMNYHYLKGDAAAALEYGAQCAEIAHASADTALQCLARQYIGQSYHLRGDYVAAERELRGNLALDPERARTTYIASCAWLAWGLAERGEFDAAYAALDRAVCAADGRHAYGEAITWAIAGLVMLTRGDNERAVLPLTRSLETSERHALTVWQPIPASLLGLALVRMGHVAAGLPLLQQSVLTTNRLGVRAHVALWTLHLAEGYLADGQSDRAAALTHEALALADAAGERAHAAHAHRVLGDICVQRQPPQLDDAVARYEMALRVASELGLRPLEGMLHHLLHQVHRARSATSEAADHGRRAEELGSQLGLVYADRWDTRTHAELTRLLIVSRQNTDLYRFLAHELAGAQRLQILPDRRQTERRHLAASIAQDRRRTQRRIADVGDDLSRWQLAVATAARPGEA